ncbi:ribbon-helix-helix domain-containing protein [Brassicibacter mesophilus]|uniref:ribbon-helix-helix domain-containing protein n=1 Tax=Brassicibacter mesophilus TaxID=745119 RepID=UPI003D221D2C
MAISKDNTQISVVLPNEVVEKLDKDATEELRTRSKQAAKIIIDYYKDKKEK